MDISQFLSASGKGNILVITGWRGVGKTSYCQQAADKCQRAGLRVAGLLSPARFDQQQKNGIFALDLKSRKTQLVASSIPGEIDGICLGNWMFDPKALEWGNQCLRRATPSEILVVDELGPLEFERQIGWAASFDVLRAKEYRLAMVVIRPECIDAFSKLGFVFQTREITRAQLPRDFRCTRS